MPSVILTETCKDDADVIAGFLVAMQQELGEFNIEKESTRHIVAASMDEYVHWFLFKDNNGQFFGTCHLQSVHNYWREGRRYYLGAFYIAPSHRKKGYFRCLNSQLKDWAIRHNGVQIYMHIHKDNMLSLGAFKAVGVSITEYAMCANHWGEAGPHTTTMEKNK